MPQRQPQPQRVCLYFGSFNPLHQTHLQLAHYALEHLGCDELWLVLSPLNPIKEAGTQLPFAWRAAYIERALAHEERIRLCLIEAELGAPHYTLRTLEALRQRHPELDFSLLIGGDNLEGITRWYHWEELLRSTQLYVYPRGEEPLLMPELPEGARVPILCQDAPRSSLSASQLRAAALRGEDRRRESAVPELWDDFVHQVQALQH